MTNISVGLSTEKDKAALVALRAENQTITMSTDIARWLATDLLIWAKRVDESNGIYDEDEQEEDGGS